MVTLHRLDNVNPLFAHIIPSAAAFTVVQLLISSEVSAQLEKRRVRDDHQMEIALSRKLGVLVSLESRANDA